MKDTLQYIIEKFNLTDVQNRELPIPISQIGRYGLASIFNQLGFKEGVEIGVEVGGYARWMFERIRGLHLSCVDPWMTYDGYRERLPQEQQEALYKMAQENLSKYNATLIRDFSVNALKLFKDKSLDFVFIDGNHDYAHVSADIAGWEKKVRSGGILAGHDYTITKYYDKCEVIPAVNDYTKQQGISPWFVLGDRKFTTYMWVKK
jgi:hypothetical protein